MNIIGALIAALSVACFLYDVSVRVLGPWYYETEYYRVTAIAAYELHQSIHPPQLLRRSLLTFTLLGHVCVWMW